MRAPLSRPVECAAAWLVAAGVQLTAAPAAADDELRTGFLFRTDVAASSLVAYHWQDLAVVDGTGEGVRLEDVSFLPGAALSINGGYSYDAPYRVGLACTGQFGLKAAGGDGIPFTEIDAIARLHVGPTFGFRLAPRVPLEVQVGLSYVLQEVFASRDAIGSPLNRFPIDRDQHGALLGVLAIWRPLGARSIFGVSAGLDTAWTFVGTSAGTAHALTTGARLGVTVGL